MRPCTRSLPTKLLLYINLLTSSNAITARRLDSMFSRVDFFLKVKGIDFSILSPVFVYRYVCLFYGLQNVSHSNKIRSSADIILSFFALHHRTFRGPIFVFENQRDTLKKVHLTKPKLTMFLSLFYA